MTLGIGQPSGMFVRIAIPALLTILMVNSTKANVSKVEIDAIRTKPLLTQEHFDKITAFVNEQFTNMLTVTDSSKLTSIVRSLVGAAVGKNPRPEAKQSYSDHFSTAVKSIYKQIMQAGQNHNDKNLGSNINISTAVVLAHCDNAILIEDLAELLQNDSEFIRYWAARGLAGARIQRHFTTNDVNTTTSLQTAVSTLNNAMQKETSSFVIAQIAQAAPPNQEGAKIIQGCTGQRVKQYQSWKVNNELADMDILNKIFNMLDNQQLEDDEQIKDLAFNALKLFSVAYQRYTQSMQYKDNGDMLPLLPEASQRELETLLIRAEVEFIRISKTDRRARFAVPIQKRKWKELNVHYLSLIRVVNSYFKIFPENQTKPPVPTVGPPPTEFIESAKTLNNIQSQSAR